MNKIYDINYYRDLKRLAELESLIFDSEYKGIISAIFTNDTLSKQKYKKETSEIKSLRMRILEFYGMNTISEEEKKDCIESWNAQISRLEDYILNNSSSDNEFIYQQFPEKIKYDSRIKEILIILKHLKDCGYDKKLKIAASHFSVSLYRNQYIETIVIGHIKHIRYYQMCYPQPVYNVKGIETKNEEVSTPSETIIHRLLEDEIIISDDYMHLDIIEKEVEKMSKQPSDSDRIRNLTIASSL